jgi:5-methylcytosine-specific restriction endonuclease McrA
MLRLLRVARAALREKIKERRSPQWAGVRDAFLETHPTCAGCGGKKRLQVHHVDPFHLHPELELVPENLITLCMGKAECHLLIGHGDDWRAWDPDVRVDAGR